MNSNKSQHTAGPWEFNLRTGYIYGNVGGPDYESVAVFKHIIYSQGEETKEANAALIAAAPEMLEALKTSYDFITSIDENLQINISELKKIINKAENKQ